MDINELRKLCQEWQSRLRLNDWEIKLFISRERDMIRPGLQGENTWEIKNKSAIIKILDPIDYPPDVLWEQDMEKTLVHELLHLHFAPFDKYEEDSMEGIAIEQAIDAIAKALVTLKRN